MDSGHGETMRPGESELAARPSSGAVLAQDRVLPATPDLPQLLHSAPAAVLLIDLQRRQVTYANSVAAELTGDGVAMPVDIDTWSAAAGLTDQSGHPMRETSSPLSRVATGVPVAGEPVEVRDAARLGSDAGDAERHRTEGRLFWVTGFPLTPADPGGSALVVLLPLSNSVGGQERQLEILRNRAVMATDLSFAVSDPNLPDDPLIWVNPAFTRLTGYSAEEAAGRNCRYLQGPNTDRTAVDRIRNALDEGRAVTEVLLNYRKDGTAFWNQISLSPVSDAAGRLVNVVGVQTDVTERVLVENERQVALTTAEEARNDLRLLTDATTWMTESLDVGDAADRLARSVVPALADYCCVDVVEEATGRANRLAAHHRDPRQASALLEIGARISPRVGGADAVSRVLTAGESVLMAEMPELPTSAADDPEALRLYRQLRPRSAMLVPLRARGRVLGVLTLCSEEPYGRRYIQRDLHLTADLAAKAALAMDNALAYSRMYDAAETLQLSMLPTVRDVDGVRAASRYLPGTAGARVGGDWYDLLALPDGAAAMGVGDVVGHDLRAAAAMGQLRAVLRSYAWEGLRAGAVLDRCDQLVQGLEMAAMATAVYARLEPGDSPRHLVYSNAGHPPPLLRRPGGRTDFLDDNLSPLLGAVSGLGRTEARVSCPSGSLLLLYTDGLTDIPGENADERQQQLYRVLAGMPDGGDAEELCDRVVTELVPDGSTYDDIALLAVYVE